jgi:hypothetical protein
MTSTLTSTAAPTIAVEGSLAVVRFDRFDLAAYQTFLACKRLPESQVSYDWRTDSYRLTTPARFADRLGGVLPATIGPSLPLADYLRDYQRWIVGDLILPAKRFAAWIDTGLGKTPLLLETARQVVAITSGRYLILQPRGIHQQTVDMARAFYGDELVIERLETREALVAWCRRPGPGIGLCNYAKLVPGEIEEFRHLAGLGADESSMLKTGGGVIKWNLIHSAKGIEYKLSATATPAPNDAMEYASQASFLEMMRSEGEILWTYFERDKHDNWTVKPHARAAFYEFMASWSVYMRNPARFGFADVLADLPAPEIHEYELPLSDVQREAMYGLIGKKGGLFNDDRLTLGERSKLAQLARGFLYQKGGSKRLAARYESAKPPMVAELAAADVADGRQVIVWTVFDEEGEIVGEHLPKGIRYAILSGRQPETERDELITRFKAGDVDVLASKPQLIGYGLNLQNCGSMVFSGFDDSFEREYQAVRRAVRPGQTRSVRVHYPVIPELEGTVFANIRAKQARFDAETAIQEEHYRRVLMGDAA